jgi:protein LSM14
MMGTEGRRPGQEIAPSNDVYDVVEFRSADIEDLQIFEPPAPTPVPPPKPQAFVDPAIISSSAGNAAHPSGGSGISAGGWPTAPRLQFGTAAAAQVASIGQRGNTAQFGSLPVAPTQPAPASINWDAAPFGRPNFGSLEAESQKATNQSSSTRPFSSSPSATVVRPNNSVPLVPSAVSSARPGTTTSNVSVTEQSDKVMAYNSVTRKMEMVERSIARSYASVLTDGAGRFKVDPQQARPIPTTDYDFAKANARLQKDAPTLDVPKEAFYDKTSSFFDNISCEATGAKDSKGKNEGRWNIETFGIAAPAGQQRRSYIHGRRGGYRGRGRPRETLPR